MRTASLEFFGLCQPFLEMVGGEAPSLAAKLDDNRLCSSAMGYCSRPRKAPEKVLLAKRVCTAACGLSKDDAH